MPLDRGVGGGNKKTKAVSEKNLNEEPSSGEGVIQCPWMQLISYERIRSFFPS